MMQQGEAIYNRTQLLLGEQYVAAAARQRVIIFGVGGVGSWCAEALLRSGFTNLTIVDSDLVCITNVNRQLMATSQNIGTVKVEALKQRLLSINADANICAVNDVYNKTTAEKYRLEDYDYIIDCIDSLSDKAELIINATAVKKAFFSSMGAALKINPTKVSVAEFWKVEGCPLARALRKRFKHQQRYPRSKFLCVYSDELLCNQGEAMDCCDCPTLCAKASIESADKGAGFVKGQTNGSLVHITGIYGFTIAGLVMEHLLKQLQKTL
ncbi:MAG: ThiF family adenylyltransferase [Muribaculaceae bacterium]